MNIELVIYLTQQALLLALLISVPAFLASLAAGIVMNLFQSISQIHEPTLHFVPRIVAVFVALAIAGAWMLGEVVSFTSTILFDFPLLIH